MYIHDESLESQEACAYYVFINGEIIAKVESLAILSVTYSNITYRVHSKE